MCLTKLQHYCGVHDGKTMDQKLALVANYRQKCSDGLSLGKSLPSTVNQYSDYYILQAAHTLFEVYEETGKGNDTSFLDA